MHRLLSQQLFSLAGKEGEEFLLYFRDQKGRQKGVFCDVGYQRRINLQVTAAEYDPAHNPSPLQNMCTTGKLSPRGLKELKSGTSENLPKSLLQSAANRSSLNTFLSTDLPTEASQQFSAAEKL